MGLPHTLSESAGTNVTINGREASTETPVICLWGLAGNVVKLEATLGACRRLSRRLKEFWEDDFNDPKVCDC